MDELEKLYTALSAHFDLGSLEDFRGKMATQEDRSRFYTEISKYADIGDYDSYEKRLGGATEVPAQGSADTSQTSGQPSGSSAEPSLVKFDAKKEKEFQEWYSKIAEYKGLDTNPDSPQHLYDYRAFYQQEPELARQLLSDDPDAHFTDIGKLPGHPTFSNESLYFNENNKNLAGRWDGEIYIPYDKNKPVINAQTGEELPDYPRNQERRQAEFPTTVALVEVAPGEEMGEQPPKNSAISDAYYSLASGSSAAGQMIAGIPEYLYRLFSVPQNLLANAIANNAGDEAAAFLRADYEQIKDLPPLQAAAKVSNYYKELSEENRAQITKFEQGLTENLLSGNFSDAGRQLLNGIAESVPSMVTMLATSGAGQAAQLGTLGRHALSALPFASGYNQELEENPNIPNEYKPVIAALNGLAEVVFEQSFGTTALVEQIISNKIGRDGVKDFVEGYLKQALDSQGIPMALVRGGVSEAATTLSQNMIDKYTGVDPNRDLMQGVMDAAVIGSVMDGSIRTLSVVSDAVVGPNKQRASQLEEEIRQEKEDLNNPEVSEQAKNIIQESLEQKTNELDVLITESKDVLSSLSPEQQTQIGESLGRLDELQAAINDPNVSEQTKATLQQQADEVSTQIDEILAQGGQDAVQVGETETVPVGERAGGSQEVDEGIREQTQTEEGQAQVQAQEEIATGSNLSQNNATRTQQFFSTVVEGADDRFKPSRPYETEVEYTPEQAEFEERYAPRRGNFDEHIATSIPRYRETQVQKGAAVVSVLQNKPDATILDIGGSEGSFVKAVTEATGARSINLEPNRAMAESHRQTPVEGSEVIEEAFYEGFDDIPAYQPTEKFDVVNESMVFQFITPERQQFVDEVADKYLKEDGLFLSEEKLKTDEATYLANEQQKDTQHKSKYYSQDQLRTKGEQVLVGMDTNQADIKEYLDILKGRFAHVGLYWNSGNFYGIAASNSKETFDRFMESVGDTSSEYTNTALGEVTDTANIRPGTTTSQEPVIVDNADAEVSIPTPTQQRLERIKAKQEEILKKLRGNLSNLSAGVNPEALADLIQLGALYIEEGVVRFADFAKRLKEDYGKEIPDQQIREIYKASAESLGYGVRGFTESTQRSKRLSAETKTALDEDINPLYETQNLKEAAAEVAQLSDAEKEAQVAGLSRVTTELSADGNRAVLAGIDLINKYEAEGRREDVVRIVDMMAESATVIGQLLRQYGEFKSSTPAGYMTIVERILNRVGRELNDRNRQRIQDLFNEYQAKLSDLEQARQTLLGDLTKENRRKVLQAEIELEKANKNLSDYITDVKGRDISDVLPQILQGSLLTLKSLVINPFANIVQGGVRAAQGTVSAGLDLAFSPLLDRWFAPAVATGRVKTFPFETEQLTEGSRATARGIGKAYRKAIGQGDTDLSKYDVKNRLAPFRAMRRVIRSFTDADFRDEFTYTNWDRASDILESTIGVLPNTMFRMLPFGDDPIFAQARAGKLVQIGKRQFKLKGPALERFVLNPDAESAAIADEAGKAATFQDATKLAEMIRYMTGNAERMINSVIGSGRPAQTISKLLTKATIPFVGTPASILQKTIRFAVPAFPMWDATKTLHDIYTLRDKKMSAEKKQRELFRLKDKLLDNMAEAAISIAVISAATTLVSLGLVSGDAPDDLGREKERSFMYNTMPPNNLNVSGLRRYLAGGDPTYQQGDISVSYIPLGLVGAMIGITESTQGEELRERLKAERTLTTSGEQKRPEEEAMFEFMAEWFDNLPASFRYFMNQSFVQSTGALFETLSEGKFNTFGTQLGRTLVNLGVPNQVAQAFRASNEYMRDVYTDDALDTFLNTLRERSGNVEDLPIRYDMWGRPIKQTPPGANPYVYQMLDIFRTQKILTDDLTYKVFDIYSKTKDAAAIPSNIRDWYKQGDFTVKLTKEERSELSKLVGEERAKRAERALRNYTKTSDPKKYLDRLSDAYRDGASIGKRKFKQLLKQRGRQ